jgi:4-amino-4-deoxy-L-arabinose transferase-like glycosyltransferase
MVQALLGVLTVAMTFAVFRRIVPVWGAFGAATLTALSPHLISADTYLLTESLFTFLCLLAMWLLGGIANERRWTAPVAGFTLAAAALTRPTLQYFVMPTALLLLLAVPSPRRGRTAVLVLVGFALPFSLWPLRNLIAIGAISVPERVIATLHHGMYPDFVYDGIAASRWAPYRFDPRSPEISASVPDVLSEIGRRFREEPARHLRWYLIGKPITFFSWDNIQGAGDVFLYPVSRSPYHERLEFAWSHRLMKVLHWATVLLGVVGCVVVWVPALTQEMSQIAIFGGRMVSMLLGYFVILHMLGAPLPRYSVPIRPETYGIAMVPISLLVGAFRRRRGSTRGNTD